LVAVDIRRLLLAAWTCVCGISAHQQQLAAGPSVLRAGEIGQVGQTTYLHGFTAAIGILRVNEGSG